MTRSLEMSWLFLFGALTVISISLPSRSKINSSTSSPSLPVTSTSLRDQPLTSTDPEMLEMLTTPSDAASIRWLMSSATAVALIKLRHIRVIDLIIILFILVKFIQRLPLSRQFKNQSCSLHWRYRLLSSSATVPPDMCSEGVPAAMRSPDH